MLSKKKKRIHLKHAATFIPKRLTLLLLIKYIIYDSFLLLFVSQQQFWPGGTLSLKCHLVKIVLLRRN